MRFKGLDLNLLVAFDALMNTRSITRAAVLMNMSQPAMSAALARMRGYFQDELLVAQGKRVFPTALAEELAPLVHEALQSLEGVIATSSRFDAATSRRTFRLVASDYAMTALLAPMMRQMASEAPHIQLDMVLPGSDTPDRLREGRVDLCLIPEESMLKEYPADVLVSENHVVVGWSGNPVFGRTLTEEEFSSLGHVSVSMGSQSDPFVDRHLSAMGKQRKIDVTVPVFSALPWMISGTERIGVLQERLARAMANHFPIVWQPLPFEFPPMVIMAQYHEARRDDGGVAWLRAELRRAAVASARA